jgi:hypothetical protein
MPARERPRPAGARRPEPGARDREPIIVYTGVSWPTPIFYSDRPAVVADSLPMVDDSLPRVGTRRALLLESDLSLFPGALRRARGGHGAAARLRGHRPARRARRAGSLTVPEPQRIARPLDNRGIC